MTEDSTPLPPSSKSSNFNLARIPAWLPVAFYTITGISIPWLVELPEERIPGTELNVEGREVLCHQNASSPLILDCSELPSGNYWLRALDPQSGKVFRRQLNKQ